MYITHTVVTIHTLTYTDKLYSPLICAAEQCSQPFVIKDLTEFCGRTDKLLWTMAEASLRDFIYANWGEPERAPH